MRKAVCCAYFGDGKFLGWYADSFGSIRSKGPKIYGYSPAQMETITSNFRSKLKKLDKKSDLGNVIVGLSIVDDSLDADSKILSVYQNVELRVVECPVYDGPNADFDEKRHENWNAYKRATTYEPGNCNWVYADYEQVNEWAANEPTEFLEVITKEVFVPTRHSSEALFTALKALKNEAAENICAIMIERNFNRVSLDICVPIDDGLVVEVYSDGNILVLKEDDLTEKSFTDTAVLMDLEAYELILLLEVIEKRQYHILDNI